MNPEAPAIPGLKGEFHPFGRGGDAFLSRDGRRRLDLALRPQGARDLHAAFLRMAHELSGTPRLSRGILAAWMPRPSDGRVTREWRATLEVLKPAIAARMALVVVRPDGCLLPTEDRELRRIGEAVRSGLGRGGAPERERSRAPSAMFFEIFKVLLHGRLLGQGAIAVGEVMRRSGGSYPTVAEALKRLDRAKELTRRSNRSVELSRFPQETWTEILALSGSLRRSRFYADRSGRAPDAAGLHRRLQVMAPKAEAVGGVLAARRWDRHFDLHGLPRLDVGVHAPGGAADLSFVHRMDPALERVKPGSPRIVLAIHPLLRAEELFDPNPKARVPWADPVETLLDLHELRLVEQAEQLIRRLRG